MNSWDWVNVIARIGVSIIVIIKLVRFYDQYHGDERFGLGVAGGCSLMAAEAFVNGPKSPFADWATALFAVGVLVYFIGRLRRQFHHARANARQIKMAKTELRKKGRLV